MIGTMLPCSFQSSALQPASAQFWVHQLLSSITVIPFSAIPPDTSETTIFYFNRPV